MLQAIFKEKFYHFQKNLTPFKVQTKQTKPFTQFQ